METNFELSERLKQIGLYLVTAFSMIISGYFHLDYTAQGIRNVQIDDLLNAWPIVSLAISFLLLLIGAAIVIPKPRVAAKIILVGAVFGWIYYLLSICATFLLISILLFAIPKSLIMFLPQSLLLFLTTNSARRILSRGISATSLSNSSG